MNNTHYKGYRVTYRRILSLALCAFTLLYIIALEASIWKLERNTKVLDLEISELREQIDILKESIETMEEEIVVIEPKQPIEEEKETIYPALYTDEDILVLTKMLWGEARGVGELSVDGKCISGQCQQAAVIWCVLNRYDAGYSNSIAKVVTAPKQFVGYRESNPVDDQLMDLVIDVLDRWNKEKHGETNVGRVLPADYLWFYGDGRHNHFRNEYKTDAKWAWELEDVYGEDGIA